MNDLLEAARQARKRAYAPYSGFAVGAALRGRSGRIHAGCNVENAAYPQGQCAEAGAIAAMVAAGEREIAEILVMGAGERPCTPCGGCRQRLAEFAAPETPVLVADPEKGVRLRTTLGALLPESFGLGAGRAAVPDAAEQVRRLAPGFVPQVGLLLGSGMGAVAEAIEEVASVRLDALAGMPASSVEGHAGRLVLGRLAGVEVACLQGRVHLYEGVPAREAVLPVRLLAELGCRSLLATSAVGAIRADLAPGDLVLVEDHINLTGANPLAGPAGEGPRFLDQSEAWAPHLKAALRRAASGLGMALPSGVYLATLGPTFETPAEVRAFRALGADLVGMSLVPEAIAARHAGLAVAGLAIVVNKAAGLQNSPLTHEETLAHAGRAAGSLARLLAAALPEIAHG